MNDDHKEDAHVITSVEKRRPRKHRIPAPIFYTIVILILLIAIMILFLFFKPISLHKDVKTRFQESLVEVKGNNGDVLEVSICKNIEYFSKSDNLDLTVFGIPVPLGTTKATLRVPVTYRFHVLLSDRWQIRTTPETVTVIAPDIRASLPPAPDVSQIEIWSSRGWARFNREELKDRVMSMVTRKLIMRARSLTRSQLIRDASRKSVESSLKNWIH